MSKAEARVFFPCALLLTLLCGALAHAPGAWAHESRPAYLEINETAPGRYDVLWRTPLLAGMRLPVLLTLPDNVRNVTEPALRKLPDSLVERRVIETEDAGLGGKRIEFSGLQGTITDVLVRVQLRDGAYSTTLVHPSQPWVQITAARGPLAVAGAYLRHGVEHILLGYDHLLFVFALMLIVRSTRVLVMTITAFTVAHSITLALATLGFVHVPQAPVEAVIALSIMFVASEILHVRAGRPGLTARSPWLVAFTFGLLHGFGFAGALSQIGLPQHDIPLALLCFNLGVEAGQLLFIGVALGLVTVARRVIPGTPHWAQLVPPYAIGSLAMFWIIQRLAAF